MQCNNCQFRQEDKEWKQTVGCDVQKDLKMTTLLTLGRNNKCPYFIKRNKEYDFGFE